MALHPNTAEKEKALQVSANFLQDKKPMLHVPILADSAKLRAMVQAMWEELPERPPKKRKR